MLGVLKAWHPDVSGPSRPGPFGEPDLRLANRADARISAAQIAAILDRRQPIEQALQAIAPDASLAGTADSMPWLPLGQLFGAFADIRGVREADRLDEIWTVARPRDPLARVNAVEIPADVIAAMPKHDAANASLHCEWCVAPCTGFTSVEEALGFA